MERDVEFYSNTPAIMLFNVVKQFPKRLDLEEISSDNELSKERHDWRVRYDRD
jgi:hypothetical protein